MPTGDDDKLRERPSSLHHSSVVPGAFRSKEGCAKQDSIHPVADASIEGPFLVQDGNQFFTERFQLRRKMKTKLEENN